MVDKKYRIGYTTGVFDLFHIGHLNILKRSKSLCSYLIVGVSTDELVMEYKYKKPLFSFEERFEIVKAIKYVDEVIPQKNRNKISAYEEIKFNVMFVGDDWKNSEFFNRSEELLKMNHVDVVYFPYTKGVSSTGILERLRNTSEEK